MSHGWSRSLGRGDRLYHLDDWATPVLHKRHADPKRLGAAGARGREHAREHDEHAHNLLIPLYV